MALFGTDGIRGKAGEGSLTPESLLAIGRAVGRFAGTLGKPLLLGRDPRRSGDAVASAFLAGALAEGRDVFDAGMLPTPAAMVLSAEEGALGVMLSASHNPPEDNGLKVFHPGGRKLDDAEGLKIERLGEGISSEPSGPVKFGRLRSVPRAVDRYLRHLKARLPELDLSGLSLVVDCARGATCVTAPGLLRELGASVRGLADRPDSDRINLGCGATCPELILGQTSPGELGVAFDGDGDRVVFVDENGQLRDGDDVLFLIASDLADRGALPGMSVVGTVMTNFGLEAALREAGIRLLRAPVGDRFIAEKLAAGDLALGGEPSGHVIFQSFLPAGDGLWTALELFSLLIRKKSRLADLAAGWRRSPQVVINVPVASRPPLESLPSVSGLRQEIAADLVGIGRMVLRYSGTEPLCRVMVEAAEIGLARSQAERMAACLRHELS